MDMARPVSIPGGSAVFPARTAITVAIEEGAAAVERVAGCSPAFLGRAAWFAGANGHGLKTVVGLTGGAAFVAIPTVPAWQFVRQVPGSYWPHRGFALQDGTEDAALAAWFADPATIGALGPLWRLGPALEDGGTTGFAAAAAERAGWTVLVRRLGTAYTLNLARLRAEGPWPKGSTLRKNRWFERQLAEHGDLGWLDIAGAAWTADVFDMLAAVECSSWVGTETDGKDAKFLATGNRRIWEAAAADPMLREMMSATILTIGGVPAAFAFRLTDGPVSHCIANGYDPRHARHSPGRVLLYRDFARAADNGVRTICWGAGDPGYKSAMGAEPGPAILDILFVRNRLLAAALRRWCR
jgi:hypothetical protein